MPGKSADFSTGRQVEESYFHRKERELIKKLKAKAAKEAARQALSEAVGVSDEGILQTLEGMGIDREVAAVLHLFPLVTVAWADGDISKEERAKIVEAARAWGVQEGTAADAKLKGWLASRPDKFTTTRAMKVICDIMQFRGAAKRSDYRADIMKLCETVAAAAGGILGLGRKVSAAERAVIKRVARDLAASHKAAADKILSQS